MKEEYKIIEKLKKDWQVAGGLLQGLAFYWVFDQWGAIVNGIKGLFIFS